MRRLPILSLWLPALCIVLAAGCTETKTRVADNVKSFDYVVVPSSMQGMAIDLVGQGVRQAAQELHANATFGGPPFPDAADQMQLVQSILSRPLKGLALEALDAAGQAKGIVAANKQHAAVVCFGSEADPPSRIVYVEPVPIKETAEQLMTILAIAAGGQGDVVIIAGARMASFQRRLIRELLRLSREPRFKGLRIRDTLYASNHPTQSRDTAVKLVDFYRDLRGIIGTSPDALAAAARVVTEKNLAGKVAVTGLGLPQAMKPWLDSQAVPAFLAFDPRQLGYLALYALDAAANKRITGRPGEILHAGSMGDFTVGADGVILLGRPELVDASNVDRFDF
ncbi:MAG: rhamnose transport system substrate-binding protein [Desulfovibrionales bacterium]|nr:rhamnose transport system substrate-binding protein [Desulfovibrionales bacterium]